MLSVAGPITNVINPEETASIDNSNRSTISVVGSANYGSSAAQQGHTNTLFVTDVSQHNSLDQLSFSLFQDQNKNSVLNQPWQNGSVSRTA
jgi:hypothetical protein